MMTISQTSSSAISDEARIAENIEGLKARISKACARVGRSSDEVQLVVVSKTVGLDEICDALSYGIADFGENRTSALMEKQIALPAVRWHFIGRIQTNKIKDFVGRSYMVHSVASERCVQAVSARAEHMGIKQRILLEVNTSGEESKDGVAPEGLPALLQVAMGLPALEVCGLMTMAAPANPESAGDTPINSEVRASFALLRRLFEESKNSLDPLRKKTFSELSMGMTDDFETAIEEGATIVRIGRAVWR
ncbi:MAG: YggS family pyridoxal phosphate-dependent enzyme [Coriobacteriales bacterium]|jgi:pyridoxal phosphate enzyme (YggS family)|nr:YggS family pyridoxal phosphate-dependent enzyme [Coriobacteriales bacterium]